MQFQFDERQGQNPQQMREKCIVTNEGSHFRGAATVPQSHRLHICAGQLRGQQEFPVKAQHLIATRRCSFRKQHQVDAAPQLPGHGFQRDRGLLRITPTYEQRADTLGQRAHHRPMRHLFLGDEHQGLDGAQRDDVQPGDMVGHGQPGGRIGPSRDREPELEYAADASIPAADDGDAPGLGTQAEEPPQGRHHRPHGQQPEEEHARDQRASIPEPV